MAKGLAVPVRPGKDGGAVVASGSEQNRKILALAIAPGDDANPFQDLGFSESIVYSNPDSPQKAVIRNAINKIVGKYPDRFKIVGGNDVKVVTGPDGDTNVAFAYKEVDTGDQQLFTTVI